jgi:hypothetical protein
MSRYAATCRRCGTEGDDLECSVDVTVDGMAAARPTLHKRRTSRRPSADPETGLVPWLGQDIGEVGTVEELERALVAYATVPADVRIALERDRLDNLLGLRT